MSQPTKCDICGTRHHAHQAHVFERPARSLADQISADAVAEASGLPASEVAEKLEKPSTEVTVSENDKRPLSQSERNARYRARNRDKYNAYMRDYRRRKKEKSDA